MPRGSRQSPPANDLRRWLRVRPSLLAIVFSLTTSCATVANVADSNGRHTGVELTPCNFTKLKPPVLCAKLWVYENRAAQSGRVIGLNIVVLPARTDAAQRDAVFYLAGGPGQAAALIASAGEDSIMQALRQERDLVFVDMRGTGDSNGLQCNFRRDRSQVQSFLAEIFDPSIVRACRLQLETVADLKYYNTRLGVEDLEEVRIFDAQPGIVIF